MIGFWSDAPGSFGVREYTQLRGRPIADRFDVHLYEDLARSQTVTGRAHIFAALDQLTPTGRALVAEVHDRIAAAAPHWTLLNDPRRVRLRAPFLQGMADAGLNMFRAHPATALPASLRYPVFVREADRHNGALTPLLESPAALRRACRALRVHGFRRRELLIIEYQHAADELGRFRKYSAFRVGDSIVRAHLMFSTGWSVKSGSSEATIETTVESADYVYGSLHQEWLQRVFDLACIDYGRIDYGVVDGRPQAWEVNLNPTLGRRLAAPGKPATPAIDAIRGPSRDYAHGNLREAFLALESATSDRGGAESRPDAVRIELPPRLLAAVRREWELARRRRQVIDLMQRAFHSLALGAPARAVYHRVFRR